MDSLHAEQCEPQMKIDMFVNAIRNTFFQQNETSTKQTQTIEQPKMEQNPSNNTKKTASSKADDTNSAYNTDTEHLPRPPRNKNQPKPGTSTRSTTQTTVKQPTRTSAASTYPQHTKKTPLLPTPPSPVRNLNYRNQYKQHITRPSAFNNRNPAFTRPSPFYSRLHQQPIITRPSPTYNNFHQQPLLLLPAFTRPYPQIQGHFPQQVYYLPVILQHPIQQYII